MNDLAPFVAFVATHWPQLFAAAVAARIAGGAAWRCAADFARVALTRFLR